MKKIAIIDDKMEILNLIAKLLEKERNIDARVYSNPHNALDDVKSGAFDLVLLDTVDPKMDSIEFLKEVRVENKKTSIVIMSQKPNLKHVLESHKYGANNYIIKPFTNLSKLLARIKSFL